MVPALLVAEGYVCNGKKMSVLIIDTPLTAVHISVLPVFISVFLFLHPEGGKSAADKEPVAVSLVDIVPEVNRYIQDPAGGVHRQNGVVGVAYRRMIIRGAGRIDL